MTPNLITLKKISFTRLFLFFVAGIIAEWYLQIEMQYILYASIVPVSGVLLYWLLPLKLKFSSGWINGVCILLLFTLFGAFITYANDIRHHEDWYGKRYTANTKTLVTVEEPLVVKPNSYKALATVNAALQNGVWYKSDGKILVYFKKDDSLPSLQYGSQLVIDKPLQEIKNSGNPGAFDYKRYCLFHDITGQVFVKNNEYVVLPANNSNWLHKELFSLRNATIKSLQEHIPGNIEQGVAEALLIGYREDLDKDLVQAYSNTGVVHIIAISGLHLGMIYAALVWIFSFFKRYRFTQIIKPIVILLILWTFTLLAGAVPSIMRSAVMFSIIIIGELMSKKKNMYNILAVSAFCMLVYDPFTLWDVGFLLSYAAVISIITFQRPIYNWLYYRNKMLDWVWSLASVTISAQVLTIPIVVFYFHQFPNLFLITNFIAVPLSGIILWVEMIMLALSFIAPVAKLLGFLLSYLIYGLDSFIENINFLPFSVWSNLQLTAFQTWMLYATVISICIWFMYKSSKAFITSLVFAVMFAFALITDFVQRNQQEKLVVYNIQKKQAIDLIQGSNYNFTGDEDLLQDNFLRNFHLKPARIFYRTTAAEKTISLKENEITNINGKKVLLLTQQLPKQTPASKIAVDILIISRNPKLYMNQLQQAFDCKLIVFDSSNPLWKIQLWKKDCDSLHLRFHSTPDDGAFVMDL